jgi:DNA-binding CsgD family transcriptional regulator
VTRVTLTPNEHAALHDAAYHGDTARETAVRHGWKVEQARYARKTAIGKLHARNLPHAVHLAAHALAGQL